MSPLLAVLSLALAQSDDPNRLCYLDGNDPYYVHGSFARLTTPQWVGEEGVEAVIVLAIDDMRGHEKWEAYLRPILERLKKIDGRAPVSIMTCKIDPKHEHLQKWLQEGLSLEVHTIDHPCPLLKDGDFAKAKSTVERCIDQMAEVPSSRPVAFRMPCCDSLNTPSPRFWAEIFNATTAKGNFLTMDSSVFNITTPKDKALPRELVVDADGREKFRKYLPFPSFVNTIEDYPYPYVIARLCWELPCAVPSDWEAQNIHKVTNPQKLPSVPADARSIADMKAAIDVTVAKKGVFNFVYHPYNWILPSQVIELIDHTVEKHGRKVKFLNFREVQERIDANLLMGQPLRTPEGKDNGVRLVDVDNDGYLDVLVANPKLRATRVWAPALRSWTRLEMPAERLDTGARFGVVRKDGQATLLTASGAWHFDRTGWVEAVGMTTNVSLASARLRDIDKDGLCELIARKDVHSWSGKAWDKRPFTLPVPVTDYDRGLRFVDLDGDGKDDIIFSNEDTWSVHRFVSPETGWEKLSGGKRGDPGEVPIIVRGGMDNGAWFHSGHLWVQNEDTAKMKDLVDRRSFVDLLKKP